MTDTPKHLTAEDINAIFRHLEHMALCSKEVTYCRDFNCGDDDSAIAEYEATHDVTFTEEERDCMKRNAAPGSLTEEP